MPFYEIKHRWTGAVLFSIEIGSFRLAVEAAVTSKANLAKADLSEANLAWANLAKADLSEANLAVPIVEKLDTQILAAIETGGTLAMRRWHTCNTTHCRAGWAIHLAGDAGYALEDLIGSSAAGALIYQVSAGYIPNFYATHAEALADIQAHATAPPWC